jgi:hypothetical protein
VGRRSREKRERREGAVPPEPGSRVEAGRRALVVSAIVAAIVGFGAGWLVRTWLDRTPESTAAEAGEKVRERVLEKTR